MISREAKATLTILGIAIVFIALISIPLFILSKKDDENKNFPNYEEIEIKKDDVLTSDSDTYKRVKKQLESDPYFVKEALISNYYYKNYTTADLQNMLWNYIFSYSLNNTQYITVNKNEGVFCLRSRYVPESFEELYGVNITTDLEVLEGYFQYVVKVDNKYCFYYSNVAQEYNNNELYIGVDGLQIEDNVVTANIYLFEFYIMNTKTELANLTYFKNYINSSNYTEASNIVLNIFNGKVTHKQLDFVINNRANHFKYQILSSKMLDY